MTSMSKSSSAFLSYKSFWIDKPEVMKSEQYRSVGCMAVTF
jgi:hypothetical protein